MKMKFTLILLTMILGLVFMDSCKTPLKSNDDKDKSAITDTINRMMAVVTRSANQLNADSVFKFLTNDSNSLYMSDGLPYTYSTLVPAFKNMYGTIKSQQIEPVITDVKIPCKDVAVWIGYMKSHIITKTDQVFEDYLCETWIWQRKPEGWKVIHYHESIMHMPSAEQKKLVETALGKLAAEIGTKSLKPEEMKPILTAFLVKFPLVYGTTLAFAPFEAEGKTHKSAPYFYRSGKEFKEVQLPESYDYTVSEWYAVPVKTKSPCWSKPYYDAGGGGIVMTTYSIPVYNKENKLTGVLTSDLELK